MGRAKPGVNRVSELNGNLAIPTNLQPCLHTAPMSQRKLYLAAYDIASPSRLRQVLCAVREYSTGGQKSVYECFLSDAEQQQLLGAVDDLMNHQEDRFFLLRLNPQAKVATLGIAVRPVDPSFFYIG